VHLPEEAMALQARGGRISCPSAGVARHQRKGVIHFIVGEKLGNSEKYR